MILLTLSYTHLQSILDFWRFAWAKVWYTVPYCNAIQIMRSCTGDHITFKEKWLLEVIILSLWGHLMLILQHLKMNDLYLHNSRINFISCRISCLFQTCCPHGHMAKKLIKVLQQPYNNLFTWLALSVISCRSQMISERYSCSYTSLGDYFPKH